MTFPFSFYSTIANVIRIFMVQKVLIRVSYELRRKDCLACAAGICGSDKGGVYGTFVCKGGQEYGSRNASQDFNVRHDG